VEATGYDGDGDGEECGTIEIDGGYNIAKGWGDNTSNGAGIGGGVNGKGGRININGGYVEAYGGNKGAGIGGGEDGDGGDVTIKGGTVIAQSGLDGTGNRAIGPGEGSDNYGYLTIDDKMMVSSERIFTTAERKNGCWYRTSARIEVCTHPKATFIVSGTEKNDTHTKQCDYCARAFEPELHDFVHDICSVCGVRQTFGGGGTGIETIENGKWEMENEREEWYTLDGRKMANGKWLNGKLPKGLYIKYGKKVVIR